MSLRRVDFPVPLGPTIAKIWELWAVKETDLRISILGLGLLNGPSPLFWWRVYERFFTIRL